MWRFGRAGILYTRQVAKDGDFTLNVTYWISGILAALLLVYLIYALLRPEEF